MKAGGEQRFNLFGPGGVEGVAARELDEEAAGAEATLAGRRDEAVEPVPGKFAEGGDQKIEEVERLLLGRFEHELPEDVRLGEDVPADERGKGFALCEKVGAGEEESLAV